MISNYWQTPRHHLINQLNFLLDQKLDLYNLYYLYAGYSIYHANYETKSKINTKQISVLN